MKTKTKALVLALCAVLLVVTTVFATMAYLTSRDEVVNTFTVGDIEITLDEADVDNSTPGENDRDKKNSYKLLPGQTYVKDPTVTVLADSEDAYVRMLVTVSDIEALKKAFPADYVDENGVFLLQKLVTGWDPAVWECVGYDAETATYEFRYTSLVSSSDADQTLPALFTNVVIPGAIDNEALDNLNGIEINVVAHAMQSAGSNNADEAWAKW